MTLIIFCFLAVYSLPAQDLKEILNNYYETVGMDKLHQVNNMVTKGKINQMGMDMTYTVTVTRSGKMYLEVPLQGMTMLRAFDGQMAWMTAPWTGSTDPVVLGEFETKAMKTQVDIDGMLFEPETKGYTMEYLGKEDMDGSPVYVIKLKDASGDEYSYYLDAENFVILKAKATLEYQGSKIETETFMSNYKPVEGIIMPFSMESKMNGQLQSTITVDEYLFNQEVNDSIFIKPEPKPKPQADPEK
jgi:outer membrane lipoprotein-sorting protein